MYEMYGEQFTMEELQNIASERNITVEELFGNNPELKEIESQPTAENTEEVKMEPQDAGATVAEVAAPETPDMESPSEDTLSVSPEISLEEKKKLPYNVRKQIIFSRTTIH